MTQLRGVDGQTYALAQGAMTVTGISTDAAGSSIQVGVPTSGRIPNGATVERMVDTPFDSADHIVLNIRDNDFSTSNAITEAINLAFGPGVALSYRWCFRRCDGARRQLTTRNFFKHD